jgi:surface protein
MGSVPAPISVSATNGVVATVGDPDGSLYPIVIDGSAATAESCTVTIVQIGSSNVATVEAICQIYAVKRTTNAPLMDVVYAQGWSASPDYMTFDEAAAVTTFGTVFKDNTEITTFEEAKYFTGLTTVKQNQFANSSIARLDMSGLQNVQGSMSYAFCKATLLEYLNLEGFNAANITSLQNAWDSCSKLKRLDISSWTDTSKVTNVFGGSQMFIHCISLEEVNLPENFCPNCPSFSFMMWYNSNYPIKKVTGWFNLQSAKYYPEFQGAPQLRQLEMRNMGTVEDVTAINYSRLSVWGVNSDEVPDAEQSLKNSFDTLYDRASAGYAAITITVPAATLEVLKCIYGDDGMLAIINKGYTIANYTPAG